MFAASLQKVICMTALMEPTIYDSKHLNPKKPTTGSLKGTSNEKSHQSKQIRPNWSEKLQ